MTAISPIYDSHMCRQAITTFDDTEAPDDRSPFVSGRERELTVRIESYNPQWPTVYQQLENVVRQALGWKALSIEHVGSTAVPLLAAKPIIDIDLTVANANDEKAYLQPLERAGFSLEIREPWWYEHRMLSSAAPDCHLHVWSVGSPEAARHLIFRNWLRGNASDRLLYEHAKTDAAQAMRGNLGLVSQYNERKQATIRTIYGRAFAAMRLSATIPQSRIQTIHVNGSQHSETTGNYLYRNQHATSLTIVRPTDAAIEHEQ